MSAKCIACEQGYHQQCLGGSCSCIHSESGADRQETEYNQAEEFRLAWLKAEDELKSVAGRLREVEADRDSWKILANKALLALAEAYLAAAA